MPQLDGDKTRMLTIGELSKRSSMAASACISTNATA